MSKGKVAGITGACITAIIVIVAISTRPPTSQYDLIIASTAGGSVITPGEGVFAYEAGAVVELIAQPDGGYRFVNWTGNVSSIANVNATITTINMDHTYSITADFAQSQLIRDWYDLDAIRDNLGASYRLMNDLDSSTAGYIELASPTANQGKGWQPIGAFTGSFDGQGYEIRDLFINHSGESYVGLFAHIFWTHPVENLGVIENVGLVDADVTGGRWVGGLVGDNAGIVNNSYSTGRVTGGWDVGGLIGCNSGTVNNSYSTSNVTGNYYVGGLVGSVTGQATVREGIVSNCYCSGSVTGTARVGGLVGSVLGDCTVSNSYSTGSVTGNRWVGGLVAMNHGGSVNSSCSTGNVTGYGHVGGLIGYNIWGTISDCYYTGRVTGGYDVGGLVGRNEWGAISDCCSAGSVTGDSKAGGLVGYNDGGSVSNSFWDIITGEIVVSAGGTDKTTTEMQDIATFSEAGWNITPVVDLGMRNTAYIWNIVNGQTYPFLSWQPASWHNRSLDG
jgi:hypothetical protein